MPMKKDNLIYLNNNEIKIEKTGENEPKRKINIAKIVGVTIIFVLILAVIIMYFIYANNEQVRAYIDENILSKEVEENSLNKILLDDYDKSTIFAYQNKIMILNGTKLYQYNTSAKEENKLDVEISSPISAINGEFFVLAEKNGSKLYMIKDGKIEWTKTIEGQIEKVNVNEIGYTTVIVTGTIDKSVIILYNEVGEELFKNHLSTNTAIDATVSKDNKYLAYAELNTSGTIIQSNIKIIDIEKARKKVSDSTILTYKADSGDLILKVEYQNNNNLVCLYDNKICIIKDGKNEKLASYIGENGNATFVSINFNNNSMIIEESTESLFSTVSKVKLLNSTNKKENTYTFEGVAKNIYTAKNKIAINFGTEIHFIDTNVWLIKKYTTKQEARNIVISDKIAGIVYRDKIEIIKL